jgi:hypothetical protein
MIPGRDGLKAVTVGNNTCEILYGCALKAENKLVFIHNIRVCSGDGGKAPLIPRHYVSQVTAALPTVKILQHPWKAG